MRDILYSLRYDRITVAQAQQALIDIGLSCKEANDAILNAIRFKPTREQAVRA